MIQYQSISTDSELARFRKHLQSNNINTIAMDFEAEYSLHQYGEALCLIQVFDGKDFYIIDPVKISENELKLLFESRNLVKLFFDAQSDKALVYKKYNIEIHSIFDLADCVYVLEGQPRGLDSMISKHLGVSVTQKKKFQRHNWTLRPINKEAIQYALGDVKYLFDLKKALLSKIEDEGLIDEYATRLITKEKKVKINPIPGVKRKKEYKKLSADEKTIFDSLFNVREEHAKKLNWPPNNVISNRDLHEIARGTMSLDRAIHPKVPLKYRKEILKG